MSKIEKDLEICVTDMHTGGEPLRIIESGYPPVKGGTILEKIVYAREHLDEYRKVLIYEPRGHFDQYGALLVEPDLADADIGVLFLHNEGYSTMCGHAVIALGRYIVDNNLLKGQELVQNGVVQTNIQCPCGLVKAQVEINDGQSGRVSFISVPAFLYKRDITINLPPYGTVNFDISYGGAFYTLVDVNQAGMDISNTPIGKLVDFATAVSDYVKKTFEIKHPFEKGLSFLYGSILTDGKDNDVRSKNLCIFADREVDRSPTGSGVTARMAAQFAKRQVQFNTTKTFVNAKTGSEFLAEVANETVFGEHNAVQIKVSGEAFYTGKTTFIREKKDLVRSGFLIR